MSIKPPHTDAQETNPSRSFATIFGSPLGVRSDFGSFFAGLLARRRSRGRPAPDIRAGGPPPPSRVSRPPNTPPLVLREGRNVGALRDSRARRSASAVGQRDSGSFSSDRI